MIVIERTRGQQSALNLALLNHVAQYGTVSYTVLFDQFGDMQDSPVNAHARFSKKMEYLTYTEQLSSTGRGHDRVFKLGPMAGKSGVASKWQERPHVRAKAEQAEPDMVQAGTYEFPANSPLGICLRAADARDAQRRATAPAINVMHPDYPSYEAPPHPALRPGAMDYQRHASRGNRC